MSIRHLLEPQRAYIGSKLNENSLQMIMIWEELYIMRSNEQMGVMLNSYPSTSILNKKKRYSVPLKEERIALIFSGSVKRNLQNKVFTARLER